MKGTNKSNEALQAEIQSLRRRLVQLEAEAEEHNAVRKALQESEARNQALVRAIPDAMFCMNREGVFLDYVAAESFETLASPEVFLGKHIQETLPASVAEQALHCIEATLQTETLQRFEYDLLIRQRWHHYEARCVPHTTDSVVAIIRDVTEQKRAVESLRQAERRYRDLFEDAPLMYVINQNREGEPFITDCNATFLHALGYRRDDVLGRPLADFYMPSSRTRLLEEGGYRRALDGVFIAEERQLVRKDGRVIDTLLHAVPEFDEAGRVAGTRGMFVDVSDRKEIKRQLEVFFSQSLDGCFFMMLDEPVRWDDSVDKAAVLDYVFAHQRNTRVNDALLAQYSARSDQFLGLTPADLFAHDLDHGRALWAAFFDKGRIRLESNERKIDGTPMWVEGEYVCLYDEQGRIKGHFGIQREITDRKQTAAERERLIEELEAKNAELERFTYTVSHDLKSPLVTIKGFLGLLAEDIVTGNTRQAEENIKQIREAADKMRRLLDELLELSRIGRQVRPPEVASLTDLAYEAVAQVAGQIAARGVAVEVARGMPMIAGDRWRLLEVLQNILENAVKYMGDQPEPCIQVGSEAEEGMVICFVRDNGIGIDPKHHDRVFGLFERLNAESEGTGIGLALAKRIIEVHGGRIWVRSEGLGSGSTFYFTLPRHEA